jgi:hypothetical protein
MTSKGKIDELHTIFFLMLCVQLSDELLVLSQEHLICGTLPFKLILEVLGFKYSSKGHSQELVLGL